MVGRDAILLFFQGGSVHVADIVAPKLSRGSPRGQPACEDK